VIKVKYGYRFSFGPWNIHEGADPFGPPVRPTRDFENKLTVYKELGFDAVQFHDDDAVPEMNDLSAAQIRQRAQGVRQRLVDFGLIAEFVAPRLWEHPMTIDGAFTSNDPKARAYALERAKKAKDAYRATQQLLETINALLEYDPHVRIAIEPKPNEPMDLAYIPTMGHGLVLGFQTNDPKRVGVLMESAHAILAGLDPSDEIAFAMSSGTLMSVHLNDQNGLKYDQDRSFGSVDLRRAFNQVRILDTYQYWKIGMIGLDVKAIRTQPAAIATKHLRNSLHTFLRLVEVVRSLDQHAINALIAQRDYEELDWLILKSLMGR